MSFAFGAVRRPGPEDWLGPDLEGWSGSMGGLVVGCMVGWGFLVSFSGAWDGWFVGWEGGCLSMHGGWEGDG